MECNKKMQKTKTFDCVEMKCDIQKRLRESMKNTPGETTPEKLKYIMEHSESPMAKLCLKMQKS
jgi:hypothetical protein